MGEVMDERPATYLDKIMRERKISNGQIGRICGVSAQAARHWRLGVYSPKISYAKLLAVELNIPRHLLRPDIWDPPPPAPIAAPAPRRKPRATRNKEEPLAASA